MLANANILFFIVVVDYQFGLLSYLHFRVQIINIAY